MAPNPIKRQAYWAGQGFGQLDSTSPIAENRGPDVSP